jgi:hypothetical protein
MRSTILLSSLLAIASRGPAGHGVDDDSTSHIPDAGPGPNEFADARHACPMCSADGTSVKAINDVDVIP